MSVWRLAINNVETVEAQGLQECPTAGSVLSFNWPSEIDQNRRSCVPKEMGGVRNKKARGKAEGQPAR